MIDLYIWSHRVTVWHYALIYGVFIDQEIPRFHDKVVRLIFVNIVWEIFITTKIVLQIKK